MPIPTEINSALISVISTIITAIGAAIVRAIEKARFEKQIRAEYQNNKEQEPCTTTTQES